uniref:Phytanoyl-CoA hydroxylase-interacting protein-like C-terminal domain-containing protein n=1 Tax=Globodera rostochiensis TaxID=31243 RepID=A0A914I3S5_GLORO
MVDPSRVVPPFGRSNSSNHNITNAAVGLVRLHNLPRYTGVGGILYFLWSAVDFEPDDAVICAFSAKNAIVRFKTQYLADEAVRYCNGRALSGHTISAHPSTVEEIDRVSRESVECPPELKKKIAEKRGGTAEAKGNGGACPAFPGLLIDSDDDDFDMMELKLPDYFLRGRPPDLVDFDDSAGCSRPGTSNSSSSSGATNSSSSSGATTDGKEEIVWLDRIGPAGHGQQLQQKHHSQQQLGGTWHQSQQMLPKRKLSGANAIPLGGYDHQKRNRPNEELNSWDGAVPQYAYTQPYHAPVAVRPVPPWPPNIGHRPLYPASGPPFHPFAGPILPAPPPLPPPPSSSALSGAVKAIRMPHLVAIASVISARHILLQWELPPNGVIEVNTQTLTIECVTVKDARVVQLGRRTEFVFEVIAGRNYAVILEGFDVPGTKVTHGIGQYRASFSKAEMLVLFDKAKKFSGEQMYPLAYWDNIYESPDEQRIMQPYTKDENGHPGCPINGSIDGFFFSTLLRGKNLPRDSPFGDVQMVMPAHKLLNFNTCNMYFADFYCNSAKPDEQGLSSVLHYITVVVCKHGSSADRFCKMKNMIQLDWFNNAFLKVHQRAPSPIASPPQYLAVCREINLNKLDLMVEVYYTEPVSLFDADDFNEVIPFGKGSSRKEGLPNNKQCIRCNIYDVRRCVNCSNTFPYYLGVNSNGIQLTLCSKCDPNTGRIPIEFA